jgi:hypothetical protein
MVEKFINAIIKRPETIATEMSGAYVKNKSISFRKEWDMIYRFLYAIYSRNG